MTQFLIAYAAAFALFLAVDAVWLGIVARGFYANQLGDLMSPRPNLAIAAGLYAVYMVGESMEPRYHNGEILYVHPFRPPEKGKYVVVQLFGQDAAAPMESMEFLVKQYGGKTDKELILFQYNPREELRFPLPPPLLPVNGLLARCVASPPRRPPCNSPHHPLAPLHL